MSKRMIALALLAGALGTTVVAAGSARADQDAAGLRGRPQQKVIMVGAAAGLWRLGLRRYSAAGA